MKIAFTQYLHEEDEESELLRTVFDQLPDETQERYLTNAYDEEEALDMFRESFGIPFYEISLECELDTDTGAITVNKVTGVRNAEPIT